MEEGHQAGGKRSRTPTRSTGARTYPTYQLKPIHAQSLWEPNHKPNKAYSRKQRHASRHPLIQLVAHAPRRHSSKHMFPHAGIRHVGDHPMAFDRYESGPSLVVSVSCECLYKLSTSEMKARTQLTCPQTPSRAPDPGVHDPGR